MIILVSSTLGYHMLSLLAAMCFFGEIVWVIKSNEESVLVWQIALFAFALTVLVIFFKLIVLCVGEWEIRNSERLKRANLIKYQEHIRLEEFIRMAEDGNLP